MATEEQLLNNAYQDLRTGQKDGAGQRLTITNRVVETISLLLKRVGSPAGYLQFVIWDMDNDLLKTIDTWGDAADVPDSDTWITITLDTPLLINEEVYFFVTRTETWTAGNHIKVAYQNTDVKADENMRAHSPLVDRDTWDCAYKYTYEAEGASTVTTAAVTGVRDTHALGGGNITSLGAPNPTAHGGCWNTTGSPDVNDDHTDRGAATETGAFDTSIRELLASTKYYFKAYATNTSGTAYGAEVTFTTTASEGADEGAGSEGAGVIAVVETRLHWVDAYGKEHYVAGTLI